MTGKCPFCGEEYEVEDSCYGRMAECPSCHRKFIIGQASAEAKPEGDSSMRRDANNELITLLKQIKRCLLIIGVLVVICQMSSCAMISTTSATCTAIGIMLNGVNDNMKQMYRRMGEMKLY